MKHSFSSSVLASIIALLAAQTGSTTAGERWAFSPDAVRVIGQPDFVSNDPVIGPTSTGSPSDVAVDPTTGKVFVADPSRSRVLRFTSMPALVNGASAEAVIGQPDFIEITPGTSINTLNQPRSIAMDSTGRLWIADSGNHRVVWYDGAATLGNQPDADGVLGQVDFDSGMSATTAGRFNAPNGVAVDGNGNVFVGDTGNCRVLVFLANDIADGVDAGLVFGQENFTSPGVASDADGMNGPRGVAVDGEGNLYVADTGNHRVLRFDGALGKSTGDDADGVYGPDDLMTSRVGSGATGMWTPYDVAVDGDGTLWVAERSLHRIIGFSDAAALGNGPDADLLLGQPDFDATGTGTAIDRLAVPEGLGTDASGRIYVADTANRRIVIFQKDLFRPDVTMGDTPARQSGSNRYNASGAGQLRTIRSGRPLIRIHAYVGNDGNVPDDYLVRGVGANRNFRASIFRITGGRKAVTGAVLRGTHVSAVLGSGARARYQWEIRPKRNTIGSKRQRTYWCRASSRADGTVDKAKALLKYRP